MNMLKAVVTNRAFWGLLVAALAPVAAQHGLTLDQDGIVNDLVSAVGVAVSLSGHVNLHKAAPAKAP